jgi:hypothetical protein
LKKYLPEKHEYVPETKSKVMAVIELADVANTAELTI